jgi:hypothetical protein
MGVPSVRREASVSGGRYRSHEYWRGCRPDLALRTRHGTRDDSQGPLDRLGKPVRERSSTLGFFGGRILTPDLSPTLCSGRRPPWGLRRGE